MILSISNIVLKGICLQKQLEIGSPKTMLHIKSSYSKETFALFLTRVLNRSKFSQTKDLLTTLVFPGPFFSFIPCFLLTIVSKFIHHYVSVQFIHSK